ncbi:MAG: hypothetical protein KJ064_17640 [Anaerolineae bacterium]|nr:hypothetical protein [Anaerolineae bacterium]
MKILTLSAGIDSLNMGNIYISLFYKGSNEDFPRQKIGFTGLDTIVDTDSVGHVPADFFYGGLVVASTLDF